MNANLISDRTFTDSRDKKILYFPKPILHHSDYLLMAE